MNGEEIIKFEELIIGFLPAMLYLIKQYWKTGSELVNKVVE